MKLSCITLAVCSIGVSFAADTTLIPQGSIWKYQDTGANLGMAWRAETFDDTAWKSGPAQLGYGDGDEATLISYGSNASNKYITTYFRRTFTVANPAQFTKLKLNLLRDDGAVVYINGVEAFRLNFHPGNIAYNTWAAVALDSPDESTFVTTTLSPALLKTGVNVIAVEVHQSDIWSSDLSFDLSLFGSTSPPAVVRGPYLQTVTTNSIVIRWRTDLPTDSRVVYGTVLGALNRVATDAAQVTDHTVKLTGLTPDTRYYYSVGTTAGNLAGNDSTYYFITSPPIATVRPIRIWAIGDWQYGGNIARWVRDAYLGYAGGARTDVWLTMGDNSQTGEDSDYQTTVFNMFPLVLRNTVLWPAIGNHDTDESGNPPANLAYFQTFNLPAGGEAGGVPSGSQRYYSFDYGNVHFICLDSMTSDRSPAGPMLTWLKNDLAATRQRWIIAYFHHAPYSKGPHDSDLEPRMSDMRRNVLPILEAGGVDLVLAGHSHVYERSYLIDGHYGQSSTFQPAMKLDPGDGRLTGSGAYRKAGINSHEGTVYVVAGTASAPGSLMATRHPAIFAARDDAGSLSVEVNGDQLDVKFILANGVIWDYFTIRKGSVATKPSAPANLAGLTDAQASAVALTWADTSNNETGFQVERAVEGTSFAPLATTGQNVAIYTDRTISPGTTYFYRVRAYNATGTSDYSNTISVTIRVLPPAAPGSLTAQALSSTQVRLTWTDGSNNEAGFRVRRSTDNVNFAVIGIAGAGSTTYTDEGLTANVTYYYRVTAYNASGESAPASASVRTGGAVLPAPPSDLRAYTFSASSIFLMWRDTNQGRATHVIERLSGNTYVPVATIPPGAPAWIDNGLLAARTYSYRVKARTSAGDSEYSNVATATTGRR